MKEIWRDIAGYEGYQISNFGRVRSLERTVVYKNSKVYKYPSVILTQRKTHNGYMRVGLGGYKQQKWVFVHRLVYETFVGPIPEGMQVNHIDENKINNAVWNLNLMTPIENTHWGTGIDRGSKKRKKPVIQCMLDGTEFFTFFSAHDAEMETNIPNGNIIHCCRGKRKQAGGYIWKYAED